MKRTFLASILLNSIAVESYNGLGIDVDWGIVMVSIELAKV